MASSLGIAGVAWFSEENYPAARNIMSDSAQLPERFEAWLHGAQTAERDLREQGLHPIRVVIVPSEFEDWCRKRKLDPDSSARRAFARFVLSESQS